ncbi:MAG: 4-phosphoerythronate dehydrogenase [Paludibacteraceae bacterium]|nr:4-phosphoerythronate dehydrogenase [Paludibacteraceae bacterium]
MKILIDSHIPFIDGILEPYMLVEYLEPYEFTRERVRSADALLIRTRTKCDKSLLEGSSVRFIASATIGMDHIDTSYCRSHGIFATNAPGCNAQGVCDYVESAIKVVAANRLRCENLVLGVVGVGHVGRLVAQMGHTIGMNVLLSDPPLAEAMRVDEICKLESILGGKFTDISELIRQADIITFHTPLSRAGAYPTWHLCDSRMLSECKDNVIIINAARGGVVDEESALDESNSEKTFVVDTWEGEPLISPFMLNRAAIATPHIAGYTLQGKINATNMCLSAISRFFKLPNLSIPSESLPLHFPPTDNWILADDRRLRLNPENFEKLRENYQLR